MELRIPDLKGDRFPEKFSKDGLNVSPPVEWSDVPEDAKELVLLFENITPQTKEPFVHWLVYKIPASWHGLPEGFKHQLDPKEPADVFHGMNSMGGHGYQGPLGTAGRRMRLRFTLFALDRALEFPPGLDKGQLLAAVRGHVLDQTDMEVVWERTAA
jgi:Raf kinase inhibitor-like YbhB/YbcL family protein